MESDLARVVAKVGLKSLVSLGGGLGHSDVLESHGCKVGVGCCMGERE